MLCKHKLARQVRFSINPFLPVQTQGFNSFSSEPAGEGLSIFLELIVEVIGPVEPSTGFIVNVTDIDRNVRQIAVPVFTERIQQDFGRSRHIGLPVMVELLRLTWNRLTDKFGPARISKISLKLNPFRKVTINSKDAKMVYFSEKFEFAAMHKLWNDDFSEQRNFEVFGKCANPSGHGHNYTLEVTIKVPGDGSSFRIGDFQNIVDNELIKIVDHKNLNIDVENFKTDIPTVENIASFAWSKLAGKFGENELHCVTIWETDKTSCSYMETSE